MVIAVGNTRVYRFDKSTVVCDIHNGYAEILVLPDRRKFVMRLKPEQTERLQHAYPAHTPQQILSVRIANALQNGFLQVDEEVA
jgi:hypothetical protein